MNIIEQIGIPPEFEKAMKEHLAIVHRYGVTSPQAQRSLMLAMAKAPEWFVDQMMGDAREMGLLPETPHGYTDDGQGMYSLEQLAARAGVPADEAEAKLAEFLAMRDELGLSNDGIVRGDAGIHRTC